jgi:hypothetical protein
VPDSRRSSTLTTGRFDVSTGSGTGSNQGGLGAGQERTGGAMEGPGYDGSEQTETTVGASGPDISSPSSGLLDVRL